MVAFGLFTRSKTFIFYFTGSMAPDISSNGPLTHVVQGSDGRAELLEEERVISLSAAKVDDLDDVHVGDDDVLRLDVQVEDTSGVQVVQTLQDLHYVGHHIVLGVSESETQTHTQLI